MGSKTQLAVLAFCLVVIASVNGLNNDEYKISVGIADITGPAAEINMMGYASMNQDTSGIHLRLFSRAVVVEDSAGTRICYVTADLQGITQIVKLSVVKELTKKYGNLYKNDNLLISATHTHSGPGGYFQYLLYLVTSAGFIPDSYHAVVDGIVKSIERAHNNTKTGYIYWNEGELLDSSINRSPVSYMNNPEAERVKYVHNTDKTMSLLKFVDKNGNPLAMINWHAVHAVSMNNTNKLISSDNKGYASLLFEKDRNHDQLLGKGPFVAIFSQANEGDSSPNIMGPRCIDTGLPCDKVTSTCNGKSEFCIAFGPGKDMFESTKIIADRQYRKAKELFDMANVNKVSGPIQFIHQDIDMSAYEVQLENKTVKTCKAALGYAFAAGTTDGPGAKFFHQGTHEHESSPFWDTIRNFLKDPSVEMVECQEPKAIILPVGELMFPYQWTPNIIPTQLLRIGNVVIAGLPGEFTTMSGRRIRNGIKKEFQKSNQTVHVTLAGLSNTYSNYIATFEEYQAQRYEGGSTMFGPHTLDAYLQQFKYLANRMSKNDLKVAPGSEFPNLLDKQLTLHAGVVLDTPPIGKKFGAVVHDVKTDHEYHAGIDTIEVTFVSGHPRNNLQLESTYLTVEKLGSNSDWKVVATDANWETKFKWKRTNAVLGHSEVTITWEIPIGTPAGQYRIRHFGHSKNILKHITPYTGTSSTFKVM